MTACYVYGKRIADDHLWANATRLDKPREHGDGPLCLRCEPSGRSVQTARWEPIVCDVLLDAHRQRTGHLLDTGACIERCYDGGWEAVTTPWWTVEAVPII